jgi:hypothetical protein
MLQRVTLKTLGTAVVLQFAMCVHASACDGQVGKVIFEDTFTDDSGGWDLLAPEVIVKPPELLITLDKKYAGLDTQNLTFNAVNGDYCVEFVLPKAVAPDNNIYLGLEFWGTDYKNFMVFWLGSNGNVGLSKNSAGNSSTIFKVIGAPQFKADPTAVNSLRVVAIDGKLMLSLNGSLIKVIRAQVPEGNLRFGFQGILDNAIDAPAPPILLKSYKVTTGQ